MSTAQKYGQLTDIIIGKIEGIVGKEAYSIAESMRQMHSHDESMHPAHLPDMVIWPQSSEAIAEIMKIAHEARIPVTARGAGSSLEGNPIPLYGGIALSFEKMKRIVAVHQDDFQVTVEAGIGYKDLNQTLARYGLFFAPDPGANASIGGMIANNAAGIRTIRYGATRDNVLQLKVITADGRILKLGSRSVKQSSAYDLLHLIIGSEGTLGIVSEATLKLEPIPAYEIAVLAQFDSVAQAVETVVAVRGSGLDPVALEFIDSQCARMMSLAPEVDLAEKPHVFMAFHANHEELLERNMASIREICLESGAKSIAVTADSKERAALWYARHHFHESFVRMHPGQRAFINDVAVPISAYPEIIAYIEDVGKTYQSPCYMIGHAGDGNIHVIFPFADEASYQKVALMNGLVVEKAISLEGTATGEHGVGIGKAKYMPAEHGEALNLMRAIKDVFDPHGILNPGKIFPDEVAPAS